MDKVRYGYEGPVTKFGTIIESNWFGETFAVSEKKARSNLAFQFKSELGLTPSAKIELPGKLHLIEE